MRYTIIIIFFLWVKWEVYLKWRYRKSSQEWEGSQQGCPGEDTFSSSRFPSRLGEGESKDKVWKVTGGQHLKLI